MNGEDRTKRIWKAIKKRLRFKGLACCGSSCDLRVSDISIRIDEAVEQAQNYDQAQESLSNEDELEPMIVQTGQARRARGMNLAMLLAAERQVRKPNPKKRKKPLIRLFAEMDGVDSIGTKWSIDEGSDGLCCVCMERSKGSAFIPCGHTYCRVCSRELWLDRESCPLCNRPINQILDIF